MASETELKNIIIELKTRLDEIVKAAEQIVHCESEHDQGLPKKNLAKEIKLSKDASAMADIHISCI